MNDVIDNAETYWVFKKQPQRILNSSFLRSLTKCQEALLDTVINFRQSYQQS